MKSPLRRARPAALTVATILLAGTSVTCIDIDGGSWRVPTVPLVPAGIVGSGCVEKIGG